MAGQPKKPRGWNYIEELELSDEFLAAVEALKQLDEFTRIVAINKILLEHSIPTTYYAVIHNFINTGIMNRKLVGDYITVTADDHGVSLRLSFDITQDEAKKFINTRWSTLVKPALESRFGVQANVGATSYPARDRNIYKAYLNRKKNKDTIRDIAQRYKLSEGRIKQIVSRQKRLIK